jgi:ABC-type glycerol-3-phosphate transport system permease component
MTMRKRSNAFSTFLFAALILVFSGGPVLLSFIGSVVPDRILLDPAKGLFSEGLNFETYRYIFTGELPASYLAEGANRAMISDAARQVPRSLVNSGVIALSSMLLNLILGAPAAFVFARSTFPGKKPSFLFLILAPLVPSVALVTPIYITLQFLGLLGTHLGIILVHTARALPFTVLILSVFFRKIPAEIFEAAVLDHCSRLQTFFRIALPLALPSVGATGLFAFMLSYSEYMFSMVLSGDAATRPVSVVMAALARNTDVSWSLLNTAIFIAIVPTLVLVVLVWRFVVEGLLGGAVKG